jgi:hypothetical protein
VASVEELSQPLMEELSNKYLLELQKELTDEA